MAGGADSRRRASPPGVRRWITRICYQSRATPQKWIDPSTEAEIERAAADKTAVLVVPIAFVSEHTETLVELDVEYRDLAVKLGVPGYFRVPTQNADAGFIASLAGLVRRAIGAGPGCAAARGGGCAARSTRLPVCRRAPSTDLSAFRALSLCLETEKALYLIV